MDATVVLGRQGRIVIPATVRASLGLSVGDQLSLHIDGTSLVLEQPSDAVAQLRSLGSSVPAAVSLVEQLLTDRARAAAAE